MFVCPSFKNKWSTPIAVRFWAKVEKTANCWIWRGGIHTLGYGKFTVYDSITVLAHRWAYENVIGPIPKGLQLDHLCRNKACVNPSHLEAVTAAENNRRSFSVSSINSKKTHCSKGHPFSGANLFMESGRRRCRECYRIKSRVRWCKIKLRRLQHGT